MIIVRDIVIRFWRVVAVFCSVFLSASLHPVVAMATEFDNASLTGTYASTGIGRGGLSPTAGMAIVSFNGNGQFSGKTILNVPPQNELFEDKEAERAVLEFPIQGKYEIAGDGSGTMTLNLPAELGEPQTSHFVITEAGRRGWHNKYIATEMAVVFDDLLPNSKALQTTVLKRRSWRGSLTYASFAGTYTSLEIGRGGSDPAAAMLIFTADGRGNIVGKSIINRPGVKEEGREVITVPVTGRYHIDPDGMGKLTAFPPDQFGPPRQARFVVTDAQPHRRLTANIYGIRKMDLVVKKVWLVFDQLTPVTKALQTAELKRRGN